MQNLIFSLNATLPVFLVMVVGYALGQLGFPAARVLQGVGQADL